MFNIDEYSSTPAYMQIVNHFKEGIVTGKYKVDDQLPSVRKLAQLINVNPNTISKAYNQLENEGIIRTSIGKGTFFCKVITTKNKSTINELSDKLRDIYIEYKLKGIEDDELLEIFKKVIKEM